MSIPVGRPGVNFADVAAVAERLAVRGDRPTAQAVRVELGRGSLATIQRHITAWRDGQRPIKSESEALPAELQRSILAHIEVSVREARVELEGELAECRAERDSLVIELERVTSDSDAAAERIKQQDAEIARQGGSMLTMEHALSEARTQAVQEREAAEAARKAAALAEMRLEDFALLRAQLADEREARRRAEIEAAELRGRQQLPPA